MSVTLHIGKMAARRTIVRRKSNRIPINFVAQSRNRKSGFAVRKAVVSVSIPSDQCSEPSTATDHEPSTATDHEPGADCAEVEDGTTSGEATSTEHARRKEKLAEKWKELRRNATKVIVEGFALPEAICCRCCTKAYVRCVQCGPCVYYCGECGVSAHQTCLYHHFPEVWKVRLRC